MNENECLQKRLKNLLDENNVTQEQLASHIGVTRQVIGQWKDGKTIPNAFALKKIAEYFKVSTDYLLGVPSYRQEICNKHISAMMCELSNSGMPLSDTTSLALDLYETVRKFEEEK